MKKEKSCGCIIIKDKEVLLIKHLKGHWDFPKGHVEENETEKETAIREVKEETNIDVEIESDKRYVIEYFTDTGNLKEVVFFVAKMVGGEIKPQETEVEEIKWVSFEDAIKIITYDDPRNLLKKIISEKN